MVHLPTHETRDQRYVALLRERFGPEAADRAPVSEWDGATCGEQCFHEPVGPTNKTR